MEDKPVKVLNPLFGLPERSHLGSRGQRSGALDHERTIHEEQRLLRNGGVEALRIVHVRVREIKHAKDPRQKLAVNESVNRASQGGRFLEELDRFAACVHIQFAGHGEQRVAHGLEVQSFTIEMPEQAVFGINRSRRRGVVRR